MRVMTLPLPAASRPSKITPPPFVLLHDPLLQLEQLRLQPSQLLLILRAFHRAAFPSALNWLR